MELIQVASRSVGHEPVQTVNARELHGFLEVGKVFGAWITERIEQFGFVEHQDYVLTVSKTGIRQNVIQKDYHLTLDMAKELAMLERNYQGKQARLYFIECERRAKAKPATAPDLTDAATVRNMLLTFSEQVLVLEAENAAMVPKVAALESIAVSSTTQQINFGRLYDTQKPRQINYGRL